MEHFFRNTPDFFGSIVGTKYHFLTLIIFAICMVIAVIVCRKGNSAKMTRNLAVVLMIEQVVEYCWYIFAPYLQDPMPLYHCRLSKLLLVVVVLFMKKSTAIKYYAIATGIYGAVAALAFPALDPFAYPHFTNFTFYITHTLIAIISVGLIASEDIKLTKKRFWQVQIVTQIMNILITLYNLITGENYAYLLEAPPSIKVPIDIPVLYTATTFVAYGILAALGMGLWMLIYKCCQNIKSV